MEKKTWILDNIQKIRRLKGIKSEIVAQDLGISQSEYSKIENGLRKNYIEFLPQIARSLGVDYHELVASTNQVQYNYGEVKDQGVVGNIQNVNQNLADKSYIEDRIRDRDLIIQLEKEQKEFFKTAYEKLELKYQELKSKYVIIKKSI